ncbi:MAG: leucine-rich repeat domain-containing protein [Aureispira sp.]
MENKIYPFKFLDSYTAEDKDLFFGRSEEVRQLYQMIYQSDTLLLYGASGTGKTSLIQCGLASQFQQHDWLDIFVRRNKNLNESLTKALLAVGGEDISKEEEEDDLDWLDDLMDTDQGPLTTKALTTTQFHLKNIYLKHFRPIYLIFDQFEELFILGSKEEQATFIATIQEILQVEHPVKLIFSIREEYLGSLYEFEKVVPELLRKKLRIDPMNLEKVKAVVLGATASTQSIVHIKEEEAEAIAEQVFEKIRGEEKTLTIQLPYLQVFLDKYYRHISKDRAKPPTTEATFTLAALHEIGDISNILHDFLDEQIVKIAHDQHCDYKLIWKILSPFVTVDGTKEPIGLEALDYQLLGIDQTEIEHIVLALMNNRILRYIEEEELYEIAHDSLALRIAEKRSDEEINLLEVRNLIKSQSQLKDETRELFSERQLAFIAPFLTRLQLNEEENLLLLESHKQVEKAQLAARRTKIVIGSSLILVFIIIGLFAISSQHQKNIAEQASQKNQKILDAMDFYEDQYALAFKNEKYGFIDKQGNTTVDFEYDKGEPFDPETGFAKMEIDMEVKGTSKSLKYLIDTSRNKYRLIKIVEELKYGGQFNTIFSKANVQWIEAKLPNDSDREQLLAAVEKIHNDVAMATSNLVTMLKQEKNKLALDFSGLDRKSILRTLNLLQQETAIKNKIELLFLKETGLKTFPNSIVAFKNLKWLDLSQTAISTLPPAMRELKQLSSLNLDYTAITSFPEIIGELTQLESLSLLGSVESISENIGQLTNLKKLSIDGDFDQLPNSIGALKNIEKLHLTSAALTTIPTTIGQLTNLKDLLLQGSFETLPNSFVQLKKLTQLHLASSILNKIPTTIGELTNLKKLSIEGVFETLPNNIGQLEQLKKLELFSLPLSAIPTSIGQLTNLRELALQGFLETLPNSIGKLENLQKLSLHTDDLKALPETIGELTNLRSFSFYGSLKTLPADIGQLTQLKFLSLNTPLETLPNSIGMLTELTELTLNTNQLNDLPESIGQLLHLKKLFIEGAIEILPSSFGHLTQLETLYLHTARLKSVPENIGQLRQLKVLSLQGVFETLPNSFGALTELEILSLENQALKTLPNNIGKLLHLKECIVKGKLESLPTTIGELSRIEKLFLINTHLKTIPETIGTLTNLNRLTLEGKFETLPNSFGHLKALEGLSIRNSVLKTLPETIGALFKLKELALETAIETLPNSFSNLSNLETLDLNDNPKLKEFPPLHHFKKLSSFNYTLYDNEQYPSKEKKLSTFSDQFPDCIIFVTNKKTGTSGRLGGSH